jgi:hypothetical protein
MSLRKYYKKSITAAVGSPSSKGISAKQQFDPEDIHDVGGVDGLLIFAIDLRTPFHAHEDRLGSTDTLKTEIIGYFPTGEKVKFQYIGNGKAKQAGDMIVYYI